MKKIEAETPTSTINIDLDPREADLLMEAINLAIKAVPNAIEFSLNLNPVAVKIAQARQTG